MGGGTLRTQRGRPSGLFLARTARPVFNFFDSDRPEAERTEKSDGNWKEKQKEDRQQKMPAAGAEPAAAPPSVYGLPPEFSGERGL